MAIKNESLAKLEKMLNLEAGTLQNAQKSEDEVELELPELIVRTPEQEAQLEANHDADRKKKYDDGKEKGVKDLINANMEKFGIKLDSEKKTFENFAAALEEKLEKKVGKPKEAKVSELEADNEALRTNLENITNQLNELKTNTEQEKRNMSIDREIDSHIPSEGLALDREDFKILFKSKHQFDVDENGKVIVKNKDGEVIKDEKTRSPQQVSNVLEQFSTPYLKKQDGGGGSGDSKSTTTSKTSYEKFTEEMKEKGYNEGGADFQREYNKRVEEGTISE